jgi:hypothetical protein
MDILALDLATISGWAYGSIKAKVPDFGTMVLSPGASDNAVFAHALHAFDDLIGKAAPDFIILEAMLPPQAMKGATSRQVRDRLAGLHAIARAVAYRRKIYTIKTATVGDVREHFINDRMLRRGAAKREVIRACQLLGWMVADDNQADACALWSYACALVDPKTALRVSPLFAGGAR